MNKKYAIMMVGKTHSGKTTFGRELEKVIDGVVLQTDPITLFLKKEYPEELHTDTEHSGNFKNIPLKMEIYNIIFERLLSKEKLVPILANSNMFPKMRDKIIIKLRKNNYKVIGVYLNFSEKFLIDRIKKAKKSTEVLRVSKSFKFLLTEKQSKIFVEPKKEEFDYFFEITAESQIKDVQENIVKLIKGNN